MTNLEDFLSQQEESEIIEAIRNAEENTSGEIRVHIEKNCEYDVFKHAIEVFHYLKMDNTKLQNGVLIYVAVKKRGFVIYGDKGINEKVDINFWNSTRDKMTSQFKKGFFKQGIIDGITETGQVLSKHFPWEYNDINELENTISKS